MPIKVMQYTRGFDEKDVAPSAYWASITTTFPTGWIRFRRSTSAPRSEVVTSSSHWSWHAHSPSGFTASSWNWPQKSALPGRHTNA